MIVFIIALIEIALTFLMYYGTVWAVCALLGFAFSVKYVFALWIAMCLLRFWFKKK